MADFILITGHDTQGRPMSGKMIFTKPISYDKANGPIAAGDHVEVDHQMSTDTETRYIRVGDFQ